MKVSNDKHKITTKNKQKDKNVLKRVILIIAIVLVVLVVLYVSLGLFFKVLSDHRKQRVIESENDYLYSSFRNYYEEDYDSDIFHESEYMSLNRNIMFSSSDGKEYSLSNIDENELSVAQKFFVSYFSLVMNGNYEEYGNIFTDEYKKNPVGFEKHVDRRFTQQRVHDIKVKLIAEEVTSDKKEYTYNGIPCAYGIYEVSFKIFHNDGTFRRDLPENGERPVIYELVTLLSGENSGKTLIKNMYTVESLKNS